MWILYLNFFITNTFRLREQFLRIPINYFRATLSNIVGMSRFAMPIGAIQRRPAHPSLTTYIVHETSFVFFVLLAEWFDRSDSDLKVILDMGTDYRGRSFIKGFLNGQTTFTKDNMEWIKERHSEFKNKTEMMRFCLMCGSHDPNGFHFNKGRPPFKCLTKRRDVIRKYSE